MAAVVVWQITSFRLDTKEDANKTMGYKWLYMYSNSIIMNLVHHWNNEDIRVVRQIIHHVVLRLTKGL